VSKILVVDDSAEFRKLVEIMLVRAGHEVISAEDGEMGLQLAAAQQPDLMMLDYMMPGMNGHDVLVALRADPNIAQIPVLMVTAFTAQYQSETGETIRLGFDDVLTKPISPKDLIARIDNLLYLRRVAD
jgi:two-component system response regulator MtrA